MFRSASRPMSLHRRMQLRVQLLEDRSVPAVFAVTNLNDLGSGSLRQAILDANGNGSNPDDIVVQVVGTVTIASEMRITSDMTIVGPGAAHFTVASQGNTRIFNIDDNVSESSQVLHVSISGMKLTGGGVGESNGGAIFVADEDVILNDMTITACTANLGRGGAIFVSSNGRLTVDRCTITGNSAVNGEGGAVYLDSNTVGQFRDSTISGNSASSDGGAIYGYSGAAISVERCTIASNTAGNNSATGHGGGIAADGEGDVFLNVQDSTINGNVAFGDGGGISVTYGQFHLSNTTISGNTANASGRGGGVYFGPHLSQQPMRGTGGTQPILEIRHCTITGNTVVTIIAVEFAVNQAAQIGPASGTGGGVFTSSDITMLNTIVAGNSAPADLDLHTESSTITLGFSLVQSLGTATINDTGGNIFGKAAVLGPLQFNGGPTMTHALLAGSPALNTGDPAFTVPPRAPVNDQRGAGFQRVAVGRLDMGAYEQQASVPPPPVTVRFGAVGADAGTTSWVKVYDNAGNFVVQFEAYPNFQGGVRVATADIDGDGIEDIITSPGPGGGPHVQVFDGSKLTANQVVFPDRIVNALGSYFCYNPFFSGGVYVAAADVNGDGRTDIITGADAGGGPHVIAWDSTTGRAIVSFYAYDKAWGGGVRVAGGDLNADGKAEIITGAGPGGGPHVRAFDSTGLLVRDFFAYDVAFHGGVYVAGGDVNNDGKADIITGPGTGGGPHVKVFSGVDLSVLRSFFAYEAAWSGGVRVASTDFNNDGFADIVTGAGPGGGPHLIAYSGADNSILRSFYAFDPLFPFGIFVG